MATTQAAAATLLVMVNLGALLLAGAVLTPHAWDGLTFKDTALAPHPGRLLVGQLRAPPSAADRDEYEACERVRFRRGVRAPSNAYSSAFYLCAPAFQLATNVHLWGVQGRGGLSGVAALFGLMSIVLGVALAHASFLYHASITVELNRLDVRFMMLFTLHNTWKCFYMGARLLLYPRLGTAAWRGLLRTYLAPALGGASLGALALAAATDSLHRNYDVLLQSAIAFMFLGSAGWAITSSQPPGGLGRRAGQLHLALFLVGIALKLLDDSKALCTTDRARDSPLQLTAAFHALTAVSSMMSDMHTSAQLSHDADAARKRA